MDLARLAFDAYNKGGDSATAGLTWDGKPVPAFEALPGSVRAKWAASAEAVVATTRPARRGAVILDVGHLGKPSATPDLGAVVDLDGDGRRLASESEVAHVLQYMVAVSAELGRRGHEVVVAGLGSYPDRHRRVVAIARQLLADRPGMKMVYAQGHLNIGAPRGMVFYDHRSVAGFDAAAQVVAALSDALPELRSQMQAAAPGGVWADAYACVRGIYAGPPEVCGLLLEPLSLDRHAGLLARLGEVGRAIGAGLADWLEA